MEEKINVLKIETPNSFSPILTPAQHFLSLTIVTPSHTPCGRNHHHRHPFSLPPSQALLYPNLNPNASVHHTSTFKTLIKPLTFQILIFPHRLKVSFSSSLQSKVFFPPFSLIKSSPLNLIMSYTYICIVVSEAHKQMWVFSLSISQF